MSEKKKTNTNMAQSILTNMLVSVEKQFIEQLFTEEGLKEYAKRLFEDGRFHKEVILAYEDITWDTVFARLKCDDFFGEHAGVPINTPVSRYFEFVEYIHNVDAGEILRQYPCGAEQITCLIFTEAWEVFKSRLITYLSETDHSANRLIQMAKSGLLEGVESALTKYGSELGEKGSEETKSKVEEAREAVDKETEEVRKV